MSLEEFNIAWSLPLMIFGGAVALVGLFWLPFRFRKPGLPLLMLVGGLLVAGAPSAISRLVPIDLNQHDKIVGTERHLTLTGWKQKDYSLLKQKSDAVVVQMANSDVTDETLSLLSDFKLLKKLDLDDTKVTDAGLAKLRELPALVELRLERTAVTDAGVLEHLKEHPTLKTLYVRSTKVGKEAAEEFKAAKTGRRVLVDSSRTDDR